MSFQPKYEFTFSIPKYLKKVQNLVSEIIPFCVSKAIILTFLFYSLLKI